MWRAVGDGFTGASPAAPRRAAMAASALRFFTLWRRHDRQRTEPPDSRNEPGATPQGALSFARAERASRAPGRRGRGPPLEEAQLLREQRRTRGIALGGRVRERRRALQPGPNIVHTLATYLLGRARNDPKFRRHPSRPPRPNILQ